MKSRITSLEEKVNNKNIKIKSLTTEIQRLNDASYRDKAKINQIIVKNPNL